MPTSKATKTQRKAVRKTAAKKKAASRSAVSSKLAGTGPKKAPKKAKRKAVKNNAKKATRKKAAAKKTPTRKTSTKKTSAKKTKKTSTKKTSAGKTRTKTPRKGAAAKKKARKTAPTSRRKSAASKKAAAQAVPVRTKGASTGATVRKRSSGQSPGTRPTIGKAELAEVRARLEEHRNEILALYQADLRVGQTSKDEGGTDIVDQANDAYNREIMFSLSNGERKQVFEIESAIARLDGGAYGTCMHCSDGIPPLRLQAVPWARYCIDCQEALEDGLIDDS